MQVLVLNSGSSSIKFQLFLMPQEHIFCSGIIERIGCKDAKFIFKTSDATIHSEVAIPSHKEGLELLASQLLNPETGIIQSPRDIAIVGHRVVHGGSYFSEPTRVTPEVKEQIKALAPLAPLHNPANLAGIEVAETIFKDAQQVAVFDTAFHQSMPEYAFLYAIPKQLSEAYNIRRYGFHGTSHKYVSGKATAALGQAQSKIISIHLGNGCSMTAIKDGKSIDHSLGFSPVSGLVMGTRSGDIDPAIIFYLAERYNYSLEAIQTLLQKQSGMLGLTGFSDLRDIEELASKGNTDCQLALDINAYRVKKYIGSYIATLNGLDAIVFTGGIGENSDLMRQRICHDLDFFGILLDSEKNNQKADTLRTIHADKSRVKIFVIPTDEELEIAKQAVESMSLLK